MIPAEAMIILALGDLSGGLPKVITTSSRLVLLATPSLYTPIPHSGDPLLGRPRPLGPGYKGVAFIWGWMM